MNLQLALRSLPFLKISFLLTEASPYVQTPLMMQGYLVMQSRGGAQMIHMPDDDFLAQNSAPYFHKIPLKGPVSLDS